MKKVFLLYQRCRKCKALHESTYTRVWCANANCGGAMTGGIPANSLTEREKERCSYGSNE